MALWVFNIGPADTLVHVLYDDQAWAFEFYYIVDQIAL